MSGLRPAALVVEELVDKASCDVVVLVDDVADADVRFANSTFTTNGVRRDRRVTVAAFVERAEGVAVGVASRSGAAAGAVLDEAVARASAGEPAPDASPLIERDVVDPRFFDSAPETDLGILDETLPALAASFDRARTAGYSLAGFATHEVATTSLGTSTGLRLRHVQPTGSIELVGRSDAASSWMGVGTDDFADVDVGAMCDRLESRLAAAARRVELPPGRYDVVMPPDAVADLVIELYAAMSGRAAEDGGSVFSAAAGTRLGERVVGPGVMLASDPSADGIRCAPFLATSASSEDVSFFDSGAEIGRTEWIADGVLRRLRYHRAGARRSRAAFTPPVDNLLLAVDGAVATEDELVARTERGLLLTCLWYIREVDPATLLLTGLTRDGVYLVERGEIVGAVNNFRFNESPVDLLGRIAAAGAPARARSREWGEWMSRTVMPPLVVEGFNMSSASQAT